jgi:hypothetical protein
MIKCNEIKETGYEDAKDKENEVLHFLDSRRLS